MVTKVKPQEKSKEIAVTGKVAEIADYIPGSDWDTWQTQSDTVAGHDLAKDELLDSLEGVPFMITAVTFRKGIKGRDGVQRAYASIEAVIAPEHVLKRRRINMAELPFEPNAQIVFNDGSTGIYRQIVAYLVATGRIVIPSVLPESGPYGETRYDVPPTEWEEFNAGHLEFDATDGFPVYDVNVRLTCPRGLRLSTYESDHNPNGAKTRYLG